METEAFSFSMIPFKGRLNGLSYPQTICPTFCSSSVCLPMADFNLLLSKTLAHGLDPELQPYHPSVVKSPAREHVGSIR